jgi:hypothetical protein
VWRETDAEDTDFKTVIRQLLEGYLPSKKMPAV